MIVRNNNNLIYFTIYNQNINFMPIFIYHKYFNCFAGAGAALVNKEKLKDSQNILRILNNEYL